MTNRLATLALCASMILSACGGGQGAEPTSPDEAPVAAQEAEPEAAPEEELDPAAADDDPETTEEVIETSSPL